MNARRGGALVVLLAVGGVAAAWGLGRAAMSRTFELPPPPPPAAVGDVEHGRHLVEHVLACGACHGADLGGGPLAGGAVDGLLWAPNLTRGVGGLGDAFTAEDWERAVRHGVGRDGRALLFMRARRWAHLSTQDLADAVAWLGTVPPVDRRPEARGSSVALPLVVALRGGVDVADDEATPALPAWGPDAAYGRYLAEIAGCLDCHGADLGGGRVAWSDVAAPDLSPGSRPGWTGAAFADALLRGHGADGRRLDASMPWRAYAGLKDTEVDALWLYVRGATGPVVADGAEP